MFAGETRLPGNVALLDSLLMELHMQKTTWKLLLENFVLSLRQNAGSDVLLVKIIMQTSGICLSSDM